MTLLPLMARRRRVNPRAVLLVAATTLTGVVAGHPAAGLALGAGVVVFAELTTPSHFG